MNRLTRLYDGCKESIRLCYFAFALIAFGTIIQSENVNIFYSFSNPVLLSLADGFLKLGRAVISNLPLIFMANLVCKKANSGYPIILSLVGFLTYLVTISMFAIQTLPSYAYNNQISSILSLSGDLRPFETGLVGSFIVAMITRYSFIHSRHRGQYSLLGFMDMNSAALVYNIVICAIAGMIVAYGYPIFFEFYRSLMTYISSSLSDPGRIGLYGFLDRVLSMLSLGNLIRYPFWFTAAGGSYSSVAGQLVYGDVNIWNYIQDASSTYLGCGRFITPYYVINMFMIPAIAIGQFASMSDKKERGGHVLSLFLVIGLSVICGNPLPFELMLLLNAPLLLAIYLGGVSAVFYTMMRLSIFLGFHMAGTNVASAMPGSFPDYIINLRSPRLSGHVVNIFFVGLVAFVLMFAMTILYYRFLAYDIFDSGKKKALAKKIILACGGEDNILACGNGMRRVVLHLKDLEEVSVHKLRELNSGRIYETKYGIGIELGAASLIVSKEITKTVKAGKR